MARKNWKGRSVKKNSLPPEGRPFILFLLVIGLLIPACSKRPTGETPKEEARSYSVIDSVAKAPVLESILKDPFSFDLKVRIKGPERNARFKASMRINPDSVLWASVAPALGIEMARVLLTDDSLAFLDRMQDRYYRGDPERFSRNIGIPLERKLLESALLGRPSIPHEEGFVRIRKKGDSTASDTLHYRPLMDSELADRLGLKGMEDPYDSVRFRSSAPMRDSLDRYLQQHPSVGRYIPFYWKLDSGEVLTRFTAIDLRERNVLELRYEAYQHLDSTRIPSRIRAKVRSQKGISTFDIELRGPRSSGTLRYPFNIPDDHEKIRP